MTPDEVVACLDAGDDDAVLGEPETQHLDFKEQPYVLNSAKARWELAKDVAALANSGGGSLVIGVATTVPADREEEVASEIKPFPSALTDV
ncbi:MAG: ATP-binding protein, partial [Actinobacteria bacterium]|nr:ATP-binding protein [Actinomycetota bacterium]